MKVYRTLYRSKKCATCEYWGAMRQVRLSTVESEEWAFTQIEKAVTMVRRENTMVIALDT